jgi:5-methylcytosine-specific restriction endonuclease McrA
VTEANYKRFSCAHCNLQFENVREKKFCSKKCNKAFIKRAGATVSRAEYLARVRDGAACLFTCEHCKKPSSRPFGGTNRDGGYANRWCSMACRVGAATAIRPLSFCKVCTSVCGACKHPFVSRRKREFCSDECKPKPGWVSTLPESSVCNRCGVMYRPTSSGGMPSACCSDKCRNESERAIKRASGSRRRALLRGVTVERVDPFVVFDRDKWRCQLCGVKTPKATRGSYEDDAPELDHIITLSEGGAHSYLNTQCACRKCNGEKSGASRGQLLLIG